MSLIRRVPKTLPWHKDTDRTIRAAIECKIKLIIDANCLSLVTDVWTPVAHIMPRRVEARLYEGASSIQAYNDPRTLQDRVIAVYKEIIESMTPQQVQDDADITSVTPSMLAHPPSLVPAAAISAAAISAAASTTGKRARAEDPDMPDPPSQSVTARAEEAHFTAERKDDDSEELPKKVKRRVSSQGCSRVFIIHVLRNVCKFVRGKALPSIFTFKQKLVDEWLLKAKQTCQTSLYEVEEQFFGGPPFSIDDPRTHWIDSHQFLTWWKNNIERKHKFKILVDGAFYEGFDIVRVARAHWSAAVVCLSKLVRRSSGMLVSSLSKSYEALTIDDEEFELMQRSSSSGDEEAPSPEDAAKIEKVIERLHHKHNIYLAFITEMLSVMDGYGNGIGPIGKIGVDNIISGGPMIPGPHDPINPSHISMMHPMVALQMGMQMNPLLGGYTNQQRFDTMIAMFGMPPGPPQQQQLMYNPYGDYGSYSHPSGGYMGYSNMPPEGYRHSQESHSIPSGNGEREGSEGDTNGNSNGMLLNPMSGYSSRDASHPYIPGYGNANAPSVYYGGNMMPQYSEYGYPSNANPSGGSMMHHPDYDTRVYHTPSNSRAPEGLQSGSKDAPESTRSAADNGVGVYSVPPQQQQYGHGVHPSGQPTAPLSPQGPTSAPLASFSQHSLLSSDAAENYSCGDSN